MKFNKHTATYYLVFIAILYFITISIFIPFYQNYFYHAYILPDSVTYMDAAHLIYKEGFAFHPTRPFGYPILIGLPYLLGCTNQNAILNFAVVLNFLFWLASVVYLHKILAKLTHPKVAFWVTLIFIFTFSYTYFIYQAMTELLFTLLLILFAYTLLMYFDLKKNTFLFAALFLLCYSTCVRPISFYFSIVFFIFCLLRFIKLKELKSIGIAIGIFLATIGLQLGMMKHESGKYTISFIQNYTIDRFLITRAEFFKTHKNGKISIHSYDDFNDLVMFYNQRWDTKDSVYNLIQGKENIVKYWADADIQYKENIKSELKNNGYLFFGAYITNLLENMKNGSFFPPLLTWEQKNYNFLQEFFYF